MNTLLLKLNKKARQILGFIPTRLPVGLTEFEAFVETFIATYDLPTSDLTSIRFILASSFLNLGSTTAYKSKFYFYLLITAASSKQVAGSIFHDIKMKQKALESAAKADAIQK